MTSARAEERTPPKSAAAPEPAETVAPAAERFAVHFQTTLATQAHPSFSAAYSGQNSMLSGSDAATSVVTDFFFGLRLWRGAEIYFQPEMSGGKGLSSTLGVAAFPSGEVYRIGNPTPTIFVGRAFLRQTIGLGGGRIGLEGGPNQLAGARDRDALTITIGKVAIGDFVDKIPISDDPHTQFMSWGLWASGAYDYPADTRGYTYGVAFDLTMGWWSVRAGVFLEPQYANLMPMEWNITRAQGAVVEFEGRYTIVGKNGAARLLYFHNDARMGSYRQVLENPAFKNDVAATRAFGRTKEGFAASINQDFGSGLGAFLRVSYNDGRNESWAFTEIDQSVELGVVQNGARWGRPGDSAGVGVVVSGLSDLHRRYLASGGYGFIIGDGALAYGPEILGEIHYRLALTKEIALGGAYQPVFNPAYNRDRGPIHIFTARAHVEF
jgi:high affinity Mn2+ porin